MAKQCTLPKSLRNSTWFKEKLMLVEAQEADLNAQLQEKVFAIAALKNALRKLKGNNVVDSAVSKSSATIAPGMTYNLFLIDLRTIGMPMRCAICNKCLFDANHDMCLVDYVNDVNVRSKSKSKRNKIRKIWKPTSKVFTKIGYSWKPTGSIFTIVGNRCPLTRITATKEVHLKENTITPVIRNSPALIVYSRKPKASRSVGSCSKAKIVESKTFKTKEPKQSWGSTVFDVPSSFLIDCRLSKCLYGIWTMDAPRI
nr:hypothetical protein [Tanacetum cinerariifolium]